jgi:hypothetical protein
LAQDDVPSCASCHLAPSKGLDVVVGSVPASQRERIEPANVKFSPHRALFSLLFPLMLTVACAGPVIIECIGRSQKRYILGKPSTYPIPMLCESSAQYYSDGNRTKVKPAKMPTPTDRMWADVCSLRKAYELRCHVLCQETVSLFTVWTDTKAWRLNCRNENDPEFSEGRYTYCDQDYDANPMNLDQAIAHFTTPGNLVVHYHFGNVPDQVLNFKEIAVIPTGKGPSPRAVPRATEVRFHDGTVGAISMLPNMLPEINLEDDIPETSHALAAIADCDRIPLFQIDDSWIVDTGCGSDLVRAAIGVAFKAYLAKAPAKRFHTANAPISAHKCIPGSLMNDIGEVVLTVDPYILKDTPSVLSVGKQIKQQYSFIWLYDKVPCLITPSLVIIPLDVHGDIPYLREGGLHTETRDHDALADLCGVRTSSGFICVGSQDEPCAPGAASSSG